MKRACLPFLLALALLLSGCGGSAAEARFRSFSEDLAARDALRFTAKLRAEYPDRSVAFKLQYALESGQQTVTVLEPESIRGIRARILPGETKLEYEELILDTGDLNRDGLTPLSALPVLVETLRDGHLDSHWQAGEQPVYQLILTDDLCAQVRFAPDPMTPVYAELFCDDRAAVYCEISDWR